MREGTGSTVIPWRVVEVRPLTNHRLVVRFIDGTEGEVDSSEMVSRPTVAGPSTALPVPRSEPVLHQIAGRGATSGARALSE